MDPLPNFVNAALILLVGLSLNHVMRGRIDRLEDRVDALATECRSEFAAIRSDLLNLALALGQQQRSAG
jgi:hypothetical protein